MARVAHIGHRKAVRKHVPDKGMALVDHDLHAVAPPLLVGVPDELDVARGDGNHRRAPLLNSPRSYRRSRRACQLTANPQPQSRRKPGPTQPALRTLEMGPGFRRDCGSYINATGTSPAMTKDRRAGG